MDFLNDLDPLLKGLWYLAIATSLLFAAFTVLSLIGFDGGEGGDFDVDGDFDGDFHSDAPLKLLSLRTVINFLLGFSWSGISFYDMIQSTLVLMLVAFAVGLLFAFIFFWLMAQFHKLAEDNTFQLSDTLHRQGEVYLNIPADGAGKGKVLVSANGAVHELDAITHGDALSTGMQIRVTGISSNQYLIVEKL